MKNLLVVMLLAVLTLSAKGIKTVDLYLKKDNSIDVTADKSLEYQKGHTIKLYNEAIIDADEEKSIITITDLDSTIELKVEKSEIDKRVDEITTRFESAIKAGKDITIKATAAQLEKSGTNYKTK